MSTCETVTTVPGSPLDRMEHLRSLIRQGRAWWGVPRRSYTGFLFYQADGHFRAEELHRAGLFIHFYRQSAGSIHYHARRRFIEDVVKPLADEGVRCRVRRVKFEGHHREVFEVTHGTAIALVVIRNHINPVSEDEVSRVVRLLEHHARSIRREEAYSRVHMCILAPSLKRVQTRLDRSYHLHHFKARYIVLPCMVQRVARQAGIDYSYALPSQARWSTGETDRLKEELMQLLRAPTTAPHPTSPSDSGSVFAPRPTTSTIYIDPIAEGGSENSSHSLGGLDPPCARRFVSSGAPGPASFRPVLERAASTSITTDMATARYLQFFNTIAEKEEALLQKEESWNRRWSEFLERLEMEELWANGADWDQRCKILLDRMTREEAGNTRHNGFLTEEQVREARRITNRYDRIDLVRRLVVNDPALRRSRSCVTGMIRDLWGMKWRTAREYCNVAYSMLHNNNEDTYRIRKAANTRRKRINHLHCMLIADKDLQANPWRLVPYATRTWGVGSRIAREYEQGAWTKFTHEKDFLEEDTTRSNIKTWLRPAYLGSLALDNPDLRKNPQKLIKHAMLLWGIQYRTADGIVSRVEAMLRSKLQ